MPTDPLKTLIPQWAGIASAVGGAVVCFLIALAIVRVSKAIAGIIGAGAGVVGASSLLPWLHTSAGNVNIDAWKKIPSEHYVNSIKLWTGLKFPDTQWGFALAGAAVLMLFFGVLPGRFGLIAIIPSLVVPYAFLHTMVLVNKVDRLPVDEVGVGAWAALGGSAVVILTVFVRAMRYPRRAKAQPEQAEPFQPQYGQQPQYAPQPPIGQEPQYGQPPQYQPQQADYDRPAPDEITLNQPVYQRAGYNQPGAYPDESASNDGATQVFRSPFGQPPQ